MTLLASLLHELGNPRLGVDRRAELCCEVTRELEYKGEYEEARKALNNWIRTNKVADGFIDFDKATQDPAHPDTFLPAYDHGDHLHPGDAGYKAMGDSIDLALFTK